MKIDILTLFPEMFAGPFDTSMLKKARDAGAVEIKIHNLRDWGLDQRKTVDDRPYGGGVGMLIRVDVIADALKDLKTKNSKTLLLTPQGKTFNQKKAKKLSAEKHLILICGHYEGFDERIREYLVDEEVSIGDFVLTGGEIPAMALTDAIVRLLPGVLEKEATDKESFSQNLLEYPQYTRPENFKGHKVPKVLLSGNHAEIEKWRHEKAKEKTKNLRPDLI